MQIAFRYNDKRLLARLISLWQGHDASHCEVVLKVNEDGTYDCGSSSWVDGGVRQKTMFLPVSRWRIYDVKGDSRHARQWFEAHAGEKYDFLGLFGFAFRPLRGWFGRWFCTEVAALQMGLDDPFRYDVATLESVCMRYGNRVR